MRKRTATATKAHKTPTENPLELETTEQGDGLLSERDVGQEVNLQLGELIEMTIEHTDADPWGDSFNKSLEQVCKEAENSAKAVDTHKAKGGTEGKRKLINPIW